MVDLVKIRKKAKERKDGKGGGEGAVPAAESASAAAVRLQRFVERAGGVIEEERAVDDRTEETELLRFTIGGEHYALEIGSILEIVMPRPVTRVPNAPAGVEGVFTVRGSMMTLLDVRGRLGHGPGAITEETRVVVVEQNGERIGFQVDEVHRVVRIRREEISAQPVVHPSEQDACVAGVFREGEQLTILLSLEKLLA